MMPKVPDFSASEKPMMAFSGVRNSWETEVRKRERASMACSNSAVRALTRRSSWRALSSRLPSNRNSMAAAAAIIAVSTPATAIPTQT